MSWYTIRTLSKEEYEREFPDESLEQENPSTDVDTDTDNDESDQDHDRLSGSSASDLLAAVMKRQASRQASRKPEVSDRKANAQEVAPDASYTQEAAAQALSAAIRKAREKS